MQGVKVDLLERREETLHRVVDDAHKGGRISTPSCRVETRFLDIRQMSNKFEQEEILFWEELSASFESQ